MERSSFQWTDADGLTEDATECFTVNAIWPTSYRLSSSNKKRHWEEGVLCHIWILESFTASPATALLL